MTLLFGCTEDSGVTRVGGGVYSGNGRVNANTSRVAHTVAGTGMYVTYTLDVAQTSLWSSVQLAGMFWDGDGEDLLKCYNSSGTLVFRIDGVYGGNMQCYYWNGSTWVTAGATFNIPYHVISGELHKIDLKFVGGVSGLFEIYKDNVLQTSGSIASAACDNIKQFAWRSTDSDSNNYWSYFSEFVVDTTSTLGCVCETEQPTATGSDTDGVGAYTNVNETQRDDTGLITLDSAGQRRSFTAAARTQAAAVVTGVVASAVLACSSSGPQKAKFYLKISGTRYYSPDITLTLSMLPYNYIWVTNPATGAAWTAAEAQAASLEWGVEAVA